MKMVFNKRCFGKNAPADIKRSLTKEHLDVLDGMEVTFKDGDEFGWIEHYEVPSDKRTNYYLYPVDRAWCSDEGQMSLFGGDNDAVGYRR